MSARHLARCLVWLVLLASTAFGRDGRDWIQGWMGYPADATSHTAHLHIITVSSTKGQLSGHFLFVNGSSTGVTLEGAEMADGTLSIPATAQIADEAQAGEFHWRTIGQCSTKQTTITSKTIASGEKQDIAIDMDVFQGAFDKAVYGRVVLKNGSWAMFELERINPK